jgi:phospholipase C
MSCVRSVRRFAWVGVAVASLGPMATNPPVAPAGLVTPASPIKHIVVIYQENHSFDNVLGAWCVTARRCNGATTGRLAGGAIISLRRASDIVPEVDHQDRAQLIAMDGGRMDGFNKIGGCRYAQHYACFQQFQRFQIPNLITLASTYAVSDATFESHPMPSWGSHLDLVAGSLDGFTGDNPHASTSGVAPGYGWGCNSNMDAAWHSSTGLLKLVPSCVPDYHLNQTRYPHGGAYRATPVPWVPTIMDEMGRAGLSWRIYRTFLQKIGTPYGWAICPTFADCKYTRQAGNVVDSTGILQDATNGTLRNLSLVMPSRRNSQHNGWSMLMGDNWIGSIVSAIQHGPEWNSTAIFITYDDCGCFYDHARPPTGLGPRVPMVIVSPYAKPGYTDSTPASVGSLLAFTERTFGLAPLGPLDTRVYDYANSFSFTLPSAPRANLVTTRVPRAELHYIATHPPSPDDT